MYVMGHAKLSGGRQLTGTWLRVPSPGALSDSSGIQGSDRVYSWEQGSTSPPPYTSLIVWHWHPPALARLAPLSSPTPRWHRVFSGLGVKGRRRIRCV
ncbi:unnamed protein product [Arctogadus glacialis]